jgi:hypothetical protein
MRCVASMPSENTKKGIDKDSVIVLVIAFFIPVIFLTLKRWIKFYLLVFGGCTGESCNCMASSCWVALGLLFTIRFTTGGILFLGRLSRHEVDQIFFGNSTALACSGYFVDVDTLFFRDVSHGWSRQSFR